MRRTVLQLGAALALLVPHQAGAAILDVGSGKTYPGPAEAMAAANAGDVILVYAGTYAIASPIAWVDGVSMEAAPGTAPVLDANSSGRIITATNCGDRRNAIVGLTLREGLAADGDAGAALLCQMASGRGYFRLEDCVVSANASTHSGLGGAVATSGYSLLVRGCTFTSNSITLFGTDPVEGGALGVAKGTATDSLWVYASTFTSNSVIGDIDAITCQGGAIATEHILLTLISGSTFTSNTAQSCGAIHCWQGSSEKFILDGCTFTGNVATGTAPLSRIAAGAVYADHNVTEIRNCTFTANTSKGRGGAVRFHGAPGSYVTGCVFRENVAGLGATSGTTGLGGALWINADCPVSYSTFVGNSATKGGAIYYGTATSLLAPDAVSYCLFYDNSVGSHARSAGGAICAGMPTGTTFQIDHTTFDGNFCGTANRGSCIADSCVLGATITAALTACLVTNNTTSIAAGGFGSGTRVFNATCSLFYNNTSDGTWGRTNCLLATDPVYLDRAGKDFRVSGLSPAWSQHSSHPAPCTDTWGYFPWCAGGTGCWVPGRSRGEPALGGQ